MERVPIPASPTPWALTTSPTSATVLRRLHQQNLRGLLPGVWGSGHAFAVESHMDVMAHELGIGPLEFRLKNVIKEGDTNVSGASVPSNGLLECIKRGQGETCPAQEARGRPRRRDLPWRVAQRQRTFHGLNQRQRRRHRQPADRVDGHIWERHVTRPDRRRDPGASGWTK